MTIERRLLGLSKAVGDGTYGATSVVFGRQPDKNASTKMVFDSLAEGAIGQRVIAPPASLFAASAAAVWYGANSATFLRFAVAATRTYRYVNLRVAVQSGNIQVGVVRLRPVAADPTIITTMIPLASSGIIACPAAGDQRIDLGYFTLPPGDYALFLWCDNTTAQFLHGLASGVTASHLSYSLGSLASGVVAVLGPSVTTRWVTGLTLEAGALTTTLLGDSITSQGSTSWFSDLDAETGYRFYPATNDGVPGERTDQILTRTAAAAVGQRFMTVLAGTNDIGQSVSAATIIANLTSIYNAIVAAGAAFCAMTIPPRLNAALTGPLPTADAATLVTVNQWIRDNYSTWAGAKLCDISWALSDGTAETSPLTANFADGVHPSATGQVIIKGLLKKSLRDWV